MENARVYFTYAPGFKEQAETFVNAINENFTYASFGPPVEDENLAGKGAVSFQIDYEDDDEPTAEDVNRMRVLTAVRLILRDIRDRAAEEA